MSFTVEMEERYVVNYPKKVKKYYKTAEEAMKVFFSDKSCVGTGREDQRWEIHYRDGTITAKVKKADPDWWPMFYYVIIVQDSSINKEVSTTAVNRDEIQLFIEVALKSLKKAKEKHENNRVQPA